jgi:hypothetical protein
LFDRIFVGKEGIQASKEGLCVLHVVGGDNIIPVPGLL